MSQLDIRTHLALGTAWVLLAIGELVQPACAEDDLDERIYEFAYDYDLPAVGYAVLVDGTLAASGAVGERRFDSGIEIGPDESFHLGSCTKAMTATLIGKLIELGRLRWDSTLDDIFPDLSEAMHPDYRGVTVNQLLEMRAGFPRDVPIGTAYGSLYKLPGSLIEQRLAFVRLVVEAEPEIPPGTEYLYSNAGYATLGAIAERVSGRSYEDLMQQYVFRPLRMRTAGYGEMAAIGEDDAPWQHEFGEGGVRPIEPGTRLELPDVVAPAGKVHVSMGDWSRFIQEHLAGARGDGRLLTAASYRRLQSSLFGGDYACGWRIRDRDWANGVVFTHSGTNKMNYSVVWMAPARNFAVLVATNIEYEGVDESCDEIVWFLIQRFLLTE